MPTAFQLKTFPKINEYETWFTAFHTCLLSLKNSILTSESVPKETFWKKAYGVVRERLEKINVHNHLGA